MADTDTQPMEVITNAVDKNLLLLAGFSGREEISQLFHFQLNLLVDNRTVGNKDVPFENLLGNSITVRLNLAGGGKRYFNGMCYRFAQTGKDPVAQTGKDPGKGPTFTSYQMELVPLFWLGTRKAQSRVFQRMTVQNILKKVLKDLGLASEQQVKFDIDESGTLSHPRDYCVQYRETDFNFACRLMEEEGIYYYFNHSFDGSNGSHQLVLSNKQKFLDPPNPLDVTYEIASTSRQMADNRVYSWTKTQTLRSGAIRLRDQCFEKLSSSKFPIFDPLEPNPQPTTQATVKAGTVTHQLKLSITDAATGLGTNEKLEIYDFPGEYAQRFDGVARDNSDQQKDLDLLAKDSVRTAAIRMQEEVLPSLMIQGASNCRQMVSGHPFTLKGHFNGDGPYVLTSIAHSATDLSYRSGSKAGFTYINNFTCIPQGLPFRPARITPKPIAGTQTAVVVGLGAKDEEVLVDKYGRVKVQFHWDRPGDQNADADQGKFKASSCWIRVAQAWAGLRWGASFWPRIGQEVIVAFLEGDPDQPIIVGSVYNAYQTPPYSDGKTTNAKLSGVKTNTTPGGEGFNELRFDDSKGKEQVFIHAQRNMDTRVNGDCMETVSNDRHLSVGWEKPPEKKRGGDQNELVYRDKNQYVKRHHTEHVGGNFMFTVGHGDSDVVGGNVDIVIEKIKKELIEKDAHLHIQGDRFEKVDGGQWLAVTGDVQTKISGNNELDVGSEIYLKAGSNVIIEAASQLTLKVGGNCVVISAAGVSIVGTLVQINSGGSAGSGAGYKPKPTSDAQQAQPTKPTVADDAKTGTKSAP